MAEYVILSLILVAAIIGFVYSARRAYLEYKGEREALECWYRKHPEDRPADTKKCKKCWK